MQTTIDIDGEELNEVFFALNDEQLTADMDERLEALKDEGHKLVNRQKLSMGEFNAFKAGTFITKG